MHPKLLLCLQIFRCTRWMVPDTVFDSVLCLLAPHRRLVARRSLAFYVFPGHAAALAGHGGQGALGHRMFSWFSFPCALSPPPHTWPCGAQGAASSSSLAAQLEQHSSEWLRRAEKLCQRGQAQLQGRAVREEIMSVLRSNAPSQNPYTNWLELLAREREEAQVCVCVCVFLRLIFCLLDALCGSVSPWGLPSCPPAWRISGSRTLSPVSYRTLTRCR